MAEPVELRDGERAVAVVYPELGGWLTRYARRTPAGRWVEVLHHDEAVVARYPDRMWAGNPVLFPHVSFNVARGKEGQYERGGQLIASPQHGFGRRVPWRVTQRSTDAVTFELTDSDRTRPSFPGAFRHELTYRLVEGRLEWIQRVTNPGSDPLVFSTGFHPYLSVPLMPGGERNACYVRLPRSKRYLPTAQTASYTTESLPAQEFGVGRDVSEAWFLGDLAAPEVALVDPAAQVEAVLNFADNPAYRFLALWSRTTDERFYCIEPWTALPNSFGRADGEVTVLPPGGEFRARLWMDARDTV